MIRKREEQIKKEKRIKKLLNQEFTYDHNGNVLVIQHPFSLDLEESIEEEVEQPPEMLRRIEMVMEDKGVIDSTLMYKLAKIRFINDKMFLEDYLSDEDAKRFMQFSEEDFKIEWFSRIPSLVEPKENTHIEDHIHVTNGVKLRDKKGHSIMKSEPKHFDNRMTLRDYYTLVSDKNLTDRHKDDLKMLKTMHYFNPQKLHESKMLRILEPNQKISSAVHGNLNQSKASKRNINSKSSQRSRNSRGEFLYNKVN
jgi:hypothetical protein